MLPYGGLGKAGDFDTPMKGGAVTDGWYGHKNRKSITNPGDREEVEGQNETYGKTRSSQHGHEVLWWHTSSSAWVGGLSVQDQSLCLV